MKKLDENVFQFPLTLGFVAKAIAAAQFGAYTNWLIVVALIGAGTMTLGLTWVVAFLYYKNFMKHGLIFDREKRLVSIFKWTWRGKQQTYDISLDEIKNVSSDVDVSTEIRRHDFRTQTGYTYNLVFEGDFGSKKVSFCSKDDWNLLQTLLADSIKG